MSLRLRPLRAADEAAVLAGHREMAAEDFAFALHHADHMTWAEYVEYQERLREGVDPSGRLVPSTFLVAVVDGELVGRVSVRHTLNDWLEHQGGHIGYGVLPGHRRRGYATEILRQSIIVARSLGVDRVLVTCDDDNVASIRTISRLGGVLDSIVVGDHGKRVRRHWID